MKKDTWKKKREKETNESFYMKKEDGYTKLIKIVYQIRGSIFLLFAAFCVKDLTGYNRIYNVSIHEHQSKFTPCWIRNILLDLNATNLIQQIFPSQLLILHGLQCGGVGQVLGQRPEVIVRGDVQAVIRHHPTVDLRSAAKGLAAFEIPYFERKKIRNDEDHSRSPIQTKRFNDICLEPVNHWSPRVVRHWESRLSKRWCNRIDSTEFVLRIKPVP